MTTEPNNVNCINSRAIIEYVRRHQPDRIDELLSSLPGQFAGLPRLDDYLCNENNWVPSSLVVQLFENARGSPATRRSPSTSASSRSRTATWVTRNACS